MIRVAPSTRRTVPSGAWTTRIVSPTIAPRTFPIDCAIGFEVAVAGDAVS